MIYQLFSNHLQLKPDAIAITTSTGERYTYRTANDRVNQWCNYFIEQGIGSQERVAVLLDHEDLHVFIFLALERINASYVPFDTDIPVQQLARDITVLELKKFIIDDVMREPFNIDESILLSLSTNTLRDIQSGPTSAPSVHYNTAAAEKITYIVSSSGSTGNKKWIPISGAGLLYWAEIKREVLKLTDSDRILATRSPAYDARIFEYVCAFSVGGQLYLLNKIQRKDLSFIVDICQKESISCLLLIASQLSVENSEALVMRLRSSGLKHLMVTGDACSLHLKTLCERYELNLWNGYGPTEATFGFSILLVNDIFVKDAQGRAMVPIGAPYGPDVRFHIIEGILYIESPYLTSAYISDKKDDSLFVFMTNAEGKTIRLFNTGDSFSEQSGFIFYQGRGAFDSHCKVNGIKVTPFFIEQCINEYNQDNDFSRIQVSVVIKKHLGKDKPFAYVVTNEGFNKQAFADYLKTRLRKEEFPIVIRMSELPRGYLSQKIDQRKLIEMQDDPRCLFFDETRDRCEPINTHHYDVIKKLWCELFKREDISDDLNFIFYGGDSLDLTAMVTAIKKELDETYSYSRLVGFKEITINTVVQSLFCKQPPSTILALISPLVMSSPQKENIFFLPALLGEGYFSYLNLAQIMSSRLDKNIYGLTDPGIADEALIPNGMEQAVNRYVAAIQSIQEKGPYHLLGFSFGATLAFEVAQKLYEQKQEISEIHLLDGFPPYFYQRLSPEDYTSLLQTVLNFTVILLNAGFDGARFEPIVLSGLSGMGKLQQIEVSFGLLEKRPATPELKNMISMAKRHLTWMLTTPKPQTKLRVCPTLYLSKKDQPYFEVFERLGLSKSSSNYHYLLWNHYFSTVTRYRTRLSMDHFSLLSANKTRFKASAHTLWPSKTKSLFKKSFDAVTSFYRLSTQDTQHSELSVFFLTDTYSPFYIDYLTARSVSFTTVLHDEQVRHMRTRDTRCTSYTSLFCKVPHEKIKQVKDFIDRTNCPEDKSIRMMQTNVPREQLRDQEQPGCLVLQIILNASVLLTLSFNTTALRTLIIDAIQQRFQLTPVLFSSDEKHLLYQYDVLTFSRNIYDCIGETKYFLADFITTLQAHIDENSRQNHLTQSGGFYL